MKSRRAYGLDSEMGERGVNAVAINTLFFSLEGTFIRPKNLSFFSLCFPIFLFLSLVLSTNCIFPRFVV